ncbi:MAG TPA: hypothetical protein PKE30_19140 [Niabella sp.]|nr:hypothetical protein [Niabella sp.]
MACVLKNKKLYSFTLPEMVISLLLISILFATGLTIYMIINNQINLIISRYTFYNDFFITKQVLKSDFAKPGTAIISKDSNRIDLNYRGMKEHHPAKISYLFDSSFILRIDGSRTDTLTPGGIISKIQLLTDSLPLLNSAKIESWYKGKAFHIQLEKTYSTEELFSIIEQNQQIHEQAYSN